MDRDGAGVRLSLRRERLVKSAYGWLRHGFLSAMGVLLAVQVALIAVGVAGILRGYSFFELQRLEQRAQAILLDGAPDPDDELPHTGPFFVFSPDRALVYSNRGRGRSISVEEYREVRYRGVLIGYFYAEEVRFLSTVANRFFLLALGVLTVGSMGVSFGIAASAASKFAQTISTAVTELEKDLNGLISLKPVAARSFSVRELTDVSERLKEVSDLLSGAEEYKRRWMQDIAHDLRTPISGLRGQLEGLRDGVLEPSTERFTRVLRDVDRLERMAGSISELHSIESMGALSIEPVSTRQLIAHIESTFEAKLQTLDSRFEAHGDIDHIVADRDLIQRALMNIVSNALTYGGPGVIISISCTGTPQHPTIRVANNGPSIPENQLPYIFQRFFRGEYSRTSDGSGLGLSIASEIVARHGGAIRAENLSPHGVAFTIDLNAGE